MNASTTMTIETSSRADILCKAEADVIPYAPKFVLQDLPASLPVCQFDTTLDFEALAAPIIENLACLSDDDFSAEPIWRDTFALTGSLRTFYSADDILKAWSDTCALRRARDFQMTLGSTKTVRLGKDNGWVEVAFEFSLSAAPAARCIGFLSLVPEGSNWKIWILRTVLDQLENCENVDILPFKTIGTDKSATSNGLTNGHMDATEISSGPFDCVVVGAGQAGLSCGGRLQALGVDYVILDKQANVGDNWTTRYDSAKLHTPREYNHLPFNRTFPESYSEFLTKDELAQGYKEWVHEFGIDAHIRLGTSLERGIWNPTEKLWTLYTTRSGEMETILSRTVIMAVGAGGQIPTMPNFKGQAQYGGQILHSVDYRTAKHWKGKSGIVIGTANTAHDVARDMVEAGLAEVTMVQRTRTHVLPCEYFQKVIEKSYNANADTGIADRASYSMPNAVSRLISRKIMHQMASEDQERFDALERAGFKVARYGDISWHLLDRFGGHYIDVGCSKMISNGLIKMKAGPIITNFTREGLAFSDGAEVKADVVVFCTGFVGDIHSTLEQIFGKTVADGVGDFWGLDDEGEVKGAFKRTNQPGIWCIGGTIPQSRYFSRHIALQVKAEVEGVPLPLYTEGKRLDPFIGHDAGTRRLDLI